MADGIEIDTSSFRAFARDLKKADPVLRKELTKRLKAAGEVVAADARARASFSSRIPGRIRVGARGNQIRVEVRRITDKGHVGEERAFEHGGAFGEFRHPVFGNRDVWVSQPARPFLHPAAAAHRAEVVIAGKFAVDEALREVHSHG